MSQALAFHTSEYELSDIVARMLDDLETNVVRKHTQGPLRMFGKYVFNTSAEEVFVQLSSPGALAAWFPTLHKVGLDNSESKVAGEMNEGSLRIFHSNMMGKLKERMLYWDRPTAYAYNASNPMMPIKNHCGLLIVVEETPGVTTFVWAHYYDYRGLVMRHMFPHMMVMMMNQGLKKLEKRFGGPGGRMRKL